ANARPHRSAAILRDACHDGVRGDRTRRRRRPRARDASGRRRRRAAGGCARARVLRRPARLRPWGLRGEHRAAHRGARYRGQVRRQRRPVRRNPSYAHRGGVAGATRPTRPRTRGRAQGTQAGQPAQSSARQARPHDGGGGLTVCPRVAAAVCPLAWIGLNPRPTSTPFWRGACCVWARGLRMGADALSDVLRAVRLTGAVFFTVDVSPPWATPVPDAATLAPLIMPSAQHLISYHLVTAGSWWAMPAGSAPVRLEAGDVIVFPRGVPHVMCSDPKTPLGMAFDVRSVGPVEQWPYHIVGETEGGDRLGLVCGFLGCDTRPFNPLLAALPATMVVSDRGGAHD